MDFNWTQFMPGVAAFVGLQILNFVLNILSNGATPIAGRWLQFTTTALKDQRREAAIEKLARLVLISRHPHAEVTRLLLFGIFMLLMISVPSVTTSVRALQESGNYNPPVDLTPGFIVKEKADLLMALVCTLFAGLMVTMITARVDYILRPKAVAKKALRTLEKYNIAAADAWAEAVRRADRRSFQVPGVISLD